MRLLVLGATLALAALATHCTTDEPQTVRVRFELRAPELCSGDATAHLERLALFFSNTMLVSATGRSRPWELAPGPRSTGQIALLDFADCGAIELEGLWRADAEELPARLTATLGLPASVNHANPALAEGPLTDPTMHWSWQAGYKFLRFEADEGDRDYLFHLGATGCRDTDTIECTHPHRAEISLELEAAAQGWSARLYPEALLAALKRGSDSDARDGRCQSAPQDLDCAELLPPHGAALALFVGGPSS